MSKELVESIVVDDADAIVESFNAVMAEKIADALEVRRVELASGIMDEAVVVHDKDGNPVGRYKNIETAKLLKPTSDGYKHSQDDRTFDKYSGKYPGGKKQRDADKDDFMKRFAKEEVEQIDEESAHSIVNDLKADGKHEEAGAAAFKHGLGRKYGQHFGLKHTYDKSEAAFHRGYDGAEAKSKKNVSEEVEQIDELNKSTYARVAGERIAQAGQVAVDAKTASRRRGEDSLSDKESSEVDTKRRLLTKSASNLLKKAGSTSTPNTARPLSAARQRRDSKIAKKVSSTIYGEEVEQVAEAEVKPIMDLRKTSAWNKYRKNAATKKLGYPTAKTGANAAESGVNSLRRGREMLRQEEAEQVAEDMTDSAKLSAMGAKNKAAALTALARYKKVGDINKLSPGHRSLVAGYLERAGGIGSLGNSIQRKVLKPQ